MRFDITFFMQCIPELIKRIPYTLYLGTISFILSVILAIVLVIIQQCDNKILHNFSKVYISFFRSTPYITQLFIFYYGLPQIITPLRTMSPEIAFVVSVGLNTSAFISEIIRGGLLSVDNGQSEAGLSIGLSRFQVMQRIVIPQAFVSILPSLGNAFVGTIKNTAVAFTIGLVEILSKSKILAARGFNYMEAYIASGLVYWMLILVIDQIQKKLEQKACRFL